MKVAITGASGFIGQALSAALRKRNDEVVPVVRTLPKAGEVGWDIEAGTIDSAGLAQVDAVVHLAGAGIGDKRWNPARKALIRDSRVDGTTLLATAMAELDSGPRILLSGSAIGFYGDRGGETLTEASPVGTGYLAELTRDWEAAASPAASAGIRTVYLRTGLVMASKGGILGRLLPLFKVGLGGTLLPGDQYMSCISYTDQVNAILWSLDNEIEGPLNLTCPEPVTNKVFTKTLGAVLGRPTFASVPQFGPRMLAGREMADNLLYISAKVIPDALVDSGFRFTHETMEAVFRGELGK